MIILVTGDFGVGKDTFADFLVNIINEDGKEKDKDINKWRAKNGKEKDKDIIKWRAKKIKSFATRKPRFEGEDTHTFISKEKWLKIRERPNCIVAETEIDGEFYGTARFQFEHDCFFSVYVVDDIGVRDMLAAKNILQQEIYVVEIFRPKSLRNIDESRMNRVRNLDSYRVYPDSVVYNTHDLISLKRDARVVYEEILDYILDFDFE